MDSLHRNFFNFCRICARKTNEGMINLFVTQSTEISLAEMVSFCTQVKFEQSENRPTGICSRCNENLHIAYDFCVFVKLSEVKFQQMMLSSQALVELPPNDQSVVDENCEPVLMKVEVEDVAFLPVAVDNIKFEVDDGSDVDFMMDTKNDRYFDFEPSLSLKTEAEHMNVNMGKKRGRPRTKPIVERTRYSGPGRPRTKPFVERIKYSGPGRPRTKPIVVKTEKKSRGRPRTKPVREKSEKKQRGRPKIRSNTNPITNIEDKDITLECFKCKLTHFNSLKHLHQHLKDHNDATPHECTVCGMYYTETNLKRHLCKGTNEASVQCEYCSYSFDSTTALLEHSKCHENQLIMKKCTDCPKYFPMKLMLEWHEEIHKITKMFFCSICNRAFSRESGLKNHILTHTSTKCKLFVYV